MDSVIIKPTFSSLSFNSMSIKTKTFYPAHSSFVKFSQFSKFKTSSVISFSFKKNPSNPENPGPKSNKNNSRNFPLSPLCIFFPILQSIKGLASSHTQKWVSRLQAYNNELESILDLPKSNHYLKNGAFGVALLSVTSTAKVKISPFVTTLAANPTFVSGLFAWIVAQSAKMALNFFVERKLDFRLLFASGGMPSSHSALCTALTTSVALCHGAADCLFPVCLGFSSIVMYDAIGVRRHAGMQAEAIFFFWIVAYLSELKGKISLLPRDLHSYNISGSLRPIFGGAYTGFIFITYLSGVPILSWWRIDATFWRPKALLEVGNCPIGTDLGWKATGNALVLNMIVEDLFQGHPISQRKLKELLGHTPLQVFAGAVVGILVACICCQGCLA